MNEARGEPPMETPMEPDDIRRLIGGYATGSLTEEQRRRLFQAALEDQELFDALQDEQALKELLDDPISREQVYTAAAANLPPPNRRAHNRAATVPNRAATVRERSWIWALTASIGAAALLTIMLLNSERPTPRPERVARLRPAAPPPRNRSRRPPSHSPSRRHRIASAPQNSTISKNSRAPCPANSLPIRGRHARPRPRRSLSTRPQRHLPRASQTSQSRAISRLPHLRQRRPRPPRHRRQQSCSNPPSPRPELPE